VDTIHSGAEIQRADAERVQARPVRFDLAQQRGARCFRASRSGALRSYALLFDDFPPFRCAATTQGTLRHWTDCCALGRMLKRSVID
jgi:hypothetical protein